MHIAEIKDIAMSVFSPHICWRFSRQHNECKSSPVFLCRPPPPESTLQAQLAECQAQVEHWQGVATICELSKQEELAELQKQYDQEIQSLQEALRGVCPFDLMSHNKSIP